MGKIKFYKQRSFSELLTTTFDFIRENWRTLLLYSVYVFLPVSLVQSFINNEFYKVTGIMGFGQAATYGIENDLRIAIYAGFMGLVGTAGSLLLYSLIFTLIDIYNHRKEGLKGITWSDISQKLWKFFGKSLLISLFLLIPIFFVVLIMVLLGYLSLFTLILTIPAAIILIIPLAFAFPGYIFSKDSLTHSFLHSYPLGFRCWGSIFGVMLLTGILASIMQSITSMPYQLTFIFNSLTASSSETEHVSPVMSFVLYLLGVIQAFGAYVASTIIPIATAYLYAHARDKYEGVTIESDIENFEQFGEREDNLEKEINDLF